MRRFFSIIILILVCFGFSACKSPQKSKQTYFFQWTDSYGRPVTLEKEPQRIVSLSPAITEIIYLLGAQDKLVGVSDYCTYPKETEQLPKMGNLQNINMEALLATHPDVVLIGSIISKKDVESIEKMGIPVITLKMETSISEMSAMMSLLGKITNHQKEGEQQAQEWSEKIKALRNGNTQKSHSPTVYYVVGFGDAGDYTAPKNSHIQEIIELAGCTNIGESLSSWNISREFLFQTDPDIILIRKEDLPQFISQHPYTLLKAVKNQHVYPIESGWIDIVSPRNILAINYIKGISKE